MKLKNLALTAGGLWLLFKGLKIGVRIQENIINELEKQISDLKAVLTPLKFRIDKIETDSVSITVKFYDLDGNTVSSKQITSKGKYPGFDSIIVKVGSKYLGFPYKYFTDVIAAANGFNLTRLYDANGFPLIFRKYGQDTEYKKALSQIFTFIKENRLSEITGEAWGSFVQLTQYNDIRTGDIYKLVVHTATGGIELIKI